MKKVLSLTLIFLLALFISACGTERTLATADINSLCNAFLHGDEVSLKKINMTPEEYEKQFLAEFTKSFTESSGIEFTPEQINKVNDSTRNLLLRSTFDVSLISEKDDNATVKITVSVLNPFDENTIMAKLPENIAEMSEAERYEAVANAMVEVLNDLQYGGSTDFNVECKYNEQAKMWLPVDIENFGETLTAKIFRWLVG